MMPKPSYKLAAAAIILTLAIGIAHSQSFPILTQYCGSGSTAVVNNLAPWYCTNTDPIITKEWMKFSPIMLIAVTLSYTIAAAIFMFGVALRNDRLRTYGIGEMYEATATALMVILFTFVAAVLFGLLPGLTVGAINPYDTALNYISATINTSYSAASNLFYIGSVDYSYSTFTIAGQIGPEPIPNVFAATKWPFYTFFFFPAYFLLSFLFDAMISLYTQFYMIVFFMYAAIPVFLVPGVIFRALIPTRNLGGMMMAMSIGFYFIMPLLFSVAYYFTSVGVIANLGQTQSILNQYNNAQNSMGAADSASSPLAVTLTQANSSVTSYWLSILFFPALIIAMTYMVITQAAEILGGMAKSSSKLRSLV